MNYFALFIAVSASLLLVIGMYIGYVVADNHRMAKEAEEEENERWQKFTAKQRFNEY